MRVRVCMCMYAYACMHMCVRVRTCMCVCMRAYMHAVCIHKDPLTGCFTRRFMHISCCAVDKSLLLSYKVILKVSQ